MKYVTCAMIVAFVMLSNITLYSETISIENDFLNLTLDTPDGLLSATDKRTGKTWKQYKPARGLRMRPKKWGGRVEDEELTDQLNLEITMFLGYDFNPARRLPLFQLVYHDSVYCTRRWNQDPGRDISLWDRHDLLNISFGTPPLIFLHNKGGNGSGGEVWEEKKERYLQTYSNVAGWHGQIGFDEMLSHRYLTKDRMVQETRFSSGKGVVVNFSKKSYKAKNGTTVKANSHHIFTF